MAYKAFNIVVGIANVIGLMITIAEYCGADMSVIFGTFASTSAIWFPIAALLLGFSIGWYAHEEHTKKSKDVKSDKEIAEDIKLLKPRQKALLYYIYKAESAVPITHENPFDRADLEERVLESRKLAGPINRESTLGMRYVLKRQTLAFFSKRRNSRLLKECEDAYDRTMNYVEELPVYRPETNTIETL